MAKSIAANSIPATEHSTMVSWTREKERNAYENVLSKTTVRNFCFSFVFFCEDSYPDGIVACVSDSYDIYNACRHIWGELLHDKVMNRNGTLVIRSDSGQTFVLSTFNFGLRFCFFFLEALIRRTFIFSFLGDPLVVLPELLKILYEKFGGHVNEKGYKVLDPHIRLVQGDGVNMKSIEEISTVLECAGFSNDNIGFGSGGEKTKQTKYFPLSFRYFQEVFYKNSIVTQ